MTAKGDQPALLVDLRDGDLRGDVVRLRIDPDDRARGGAGPAPLWSVTPRPWQTGGSNNSASIVASTLPSGERRTTEPLPRKVHKDPNPEASQSGSAGNSTLASSTASSWTGSTEGVGAVGVTFGLGSSASAHHGEDEHDASAMNTAMANRHDKRAGGPGRHDVLRREGMGSPQCRPESHPAKRDHVPRPLGSESRRLARRGRRKPEPARDDRGPDQPTPAIVPLRFRWEGVTGATSSQVRVGPHGGTCSSLLVRPT